MRKFYRQVIEIEVLSEDEPIQYDGLRDLSTLAYHITEGNSSGVSREISRREITGAVAASLLMQQGSDTSFFQLDEQGNDLTEVQ